MADRQNDSLSTPDATVTEIRNRRFDSRDFDTIAQYIVEEKDRRKKARKDREEQWKEIDRQLAMGCRQDSEQQLDSLGALRRNQPGELVTGL